MRRLSLSLKLGAVVSLLLGSAALMATVSLKKMDSINASMSNITGELMMKVDRSQTLRDLARRMAIAERTLNSTDGSEMKQQAQTEMLDTTRALLRQSRESLDSKVELSSPKRIEWLRKVESTGSQLLNGQISNPRAAIQDLQFVINQIVIDDKNEMDRVSLQAENDCANARYVLNLVLAGTVLFGLVFSFLILRMLSKAIGEVTEQLKSNSSSMASASSELSDSSKELSDGAQSQSDAILEAGAAVRAIHDISLTCDTAAKKGKQVVGEMIGAIDQIKEAHSKIKQQVNDGNHKLSEIVSVIHEIAEKTKIVNDIVLQTKLLSFNASVEAARAGAQGKGFGVVAEEVRSLTQLTGNAAREISQLIDDSLRKVETIVRETGGRVETLAQAGAERIEFGTVIAAKCSQALDEITLTSDEQRKKVEGILRSVSTTEERAKETIQVAGEVFRIGQALSEQSLALNETVVSLQLTVHGQVDPKSIVRRARVLAFKPKNAKREAEYEEIKLKNGTDG